MAGKPLLALLEIGQSPQPEMEAEFYHVLGNGCDIRTFGALDHLHRDEIAQHPPASGNDMLATTLPPDGQPALISKRLVIDGLRRVIEDLQEFNVQIGILCCTGRFPEIESSNVLSAADIVTGTVRDRVAKGTRLGVFVPDQAHCPDTVEQWSQEGYDVAAVALLPEATREAIEVAARRMRDLAPDSVLYDCMGYTHELQARAEAIHSTPGILAVNTVARRAGKLLGVTVVNA